MRKLLDISVAALEEAAFDHGVELVEMHMRGRGHGREFILLDSNDVTLAHLRCFEKTVQILDVTLYGAPEGTRQENSFEHWTKVVHSPRDFGPMARSLVYYYIMRREGRTD